MKLFIQTLIVSQSSDFYIEASIRWSFFNVIFPLLPILFNLILLKVGSLKPDWVELLKDGQLFFFSTTISANSIGSLLFIDPNNQILATIITCLLILIIFCSAGLFALSSFLKLKNMDIIDNKVFSIFSAGCAFFTVILSYFAFIQGGLQ